EARLPNGEVVTVPHLGETHAIGSRITIFIRPEDIRIRRSGEAVDGEAATQAVIRDVLYVGEAFKLTPALGDEPIVVRAPRGAAGELTVGSRVSLTWPVQRSRPLAPAATLAP